MAKIRIDQAGVYLHEHGNRCPFCRSDRLDSGPIIGTDYGQAEATVKCEDCSSTWIDVYTLTNILDYQE